jgi:hypothetical protein
MRSFKLQTIKHQNFITVDRKKVGFHLTRVTKLLNVCRNDARVSKIVLIIRFNDVFIPSVYLSTIFVPIIYDCFRRCSVYKANHSKFLEQLINLDEIITVFLEFIYCSLIGKQISYTFC